MVGDYNADMRAIVCAVLALAAVGCGGVNRSSPYGAIGPRQVVAGDLRSLTRVASVEMGCPEGSVRSRQVTDRVWQVEACGQSREYAWNGTGGAYGWQSIAPVGAYASNELSCPPDAIVVAAPQDGVRNVRGCGQRATYQLACDVRQCNWTMTDRAEERPQVQPPLVVPAPPTAAPPSGRPGPYATRPGGPSGAVVTPPSRPLDPGIERGIRDVIDAQRGAILRCTGSQPARVYARWGLDGRVWVSLGPPFTGTAVQSCVEESIGAFQVTSGTPGELSHMVD